MKLVALTVAGLILTGASAVAAGTEPVRQLVYTFTYSMTENTAVHNSGFDSTGGTSGASSGVDSYSHQNGANGTVAVSVEREQPDRGLVVTVSETVDGRTTPGAKCVVWSTGTMICDPNATIAPEEYAAVRFLGVNFVDPALLDANRHWHLGSDSANYSAVSDYRISKLDGAMMTIEEARKLTYRSGMTSTADVNSTLVYDYAHKMPTTVQEITTAHTTHEGRERDQTMTVSLSLKNDTLAQKP